MKSPTTTEGSRAAGWLRAWRGRVASAGSVGDYLTSVGLKTNEDKADYSRLYDLLEVLNSDPSEVSADDLEAVARCR